MKNKKENPAKVRRRIMKLWSEKVRSACDNRCSICGLKAGDIFNEKRQKIDAHHIEHRSNASLRFDLLNGISLCVWHHKFGSDFAAHRSISFVDWLMKTRPKQYQYILEHRKDIVDVNDRETLLKIEQKLKGELTEEEKSILNIEDMLKLNEKEKLRPILKIKKQKDKTSLFDDVSEDKDIEQARYSGLENY